VVHDGRPGAPGGYRMRVLYLAPEALPEALMGPTVDRPALRAPGLAAELGWVHATLRCADRAFEAEVRLQLLLDAIRADFGPGSAVPTLPAVRDTAAEAVRGYLDEHLFGRPMMRDVADVVGASPSSLARAFRATFGITPHAYRERRRIEAARDRILRGQPLADVAAELGYVDQAHLTRRFRRFLGTTPGRFARGT
jgi:AraC-like DNA-binding protein